MVAYSFKSRFTDSILRGLGIDTGAPRRILPKCQTVRAIGKKRHARPGEIIQLYTGLRTKKAKKLGEAVCTRTAPIKIEFENAHGPIIDIGVDVYIDGQLLTEEETVKFALDDGFLTIDDFIMFWADNPVDQDKIVIYWGVKP